MRMHCIEIIHETRAYVDTWTDWPANGKEAINIDKSGAEDEADGMGKMMKYGADDAAWRMPNICHCRPMIPPLHGIC